MNEVSKTPPRPEEEQAPWATPPRKRRLDSDNDGEPRTKRARLTRKNLSLFNKMGKKESGKVPGPASTPSTGRTSTSKTVSTTSSGFAIQARKNGILNPVYAKPPPNLGDLRERLAAPRGTASPPESAYVDYVSTVAGAKNEATLVVEMAGELLKKYGEKGYTRVFNQAFTGFPEDVGLNNGLSTPQPDFVEGLRMEEYLPFPVDERVSGAVLYKDDPLSITLPHVAGEWKGPGKDMEEARLQAAYDGAALVYAREQAIGSMQKPYVPGYAKITTFTTDGTNLNLFAHHAEPTEDGTVEYHQYPIKSVNLVDSYEGFRDGRRHLRNAQDLAREESQSLKDELKEHWKARGSRPVSLPAIEDDYEIVEHPPVYQPTPPTSTKPRHGKAPSSHSSHSSKAAPPVGDCAPRNGGQKRKASLSQRSSSASSKQSSQYRNYWKREIKSGRYYHKHSDGTISWLDEDDDEN